MSPINFHNPERPSLGRNFPYPLLIVFLVATIAMVPLLRAQNGSWTTGASMPTAREALFTASIGQNVYAIGGRVGTTVVGVNEVYNTATNSWSTAPAMLTPRFDGATAVVGGILYTIGGGTGNSVESNIVEAYDPSSNTWSAKASMPGSLNSIYAVVENGIIYVAGGYNGNRVNTLFAYNPVSNSWSTLAALKVSKSQPAVALIGSSIIAAGGLTGSGGTTDNEGYNAATNIWSNLAPLPTARQSGCFGAINGVLYFAGGNSTGSGSVATMDAYNAAANTWQSGLPTLPVAVANMGSATVGSKLYCIGGSNTYGGTDYNYVQIYQPPVPPPAINPNGVISASGFGGFASIAPGDFVEIYGSNLAADTRSWATADFNGINAPTSLDGTSVTIGGQQAFLSYISPGQVNALVPSTVGTGPQPVIVTSPSGTSAAFTVNVNAVEPGLLATSLFNLNGVQYAVAFNPDGTYVLPVGAIAGLASHPAKPGDEIVFYGLGFGPVTPNSPAGQIVEQATTLVTPLQMFIGGAPAIADYAGLAPSFTGLYQFNIVVPNVPAGNALPVTFSLGSTGSSQTLFLTIGN